MAIGIDADTSGGRSQQWAITIAVAALMRSDRNIVTTNTSARLRSAKSNNQSPVPDCPGADHRWDRVWACSHGASGCCEGHYGHSGLRQYR